MACSAVTVANWLAESAGPLPSDGGLKASTLKVYLTAILSTRRALGTALESNPRAFHFLLMVRQGLINRTDTTGSPADADEDWEIPQLFDFWVTQPDNGELTILQLRDKTLSLCLAVGIARPSDLARLDLRTLKRGEKQVSIKILQGKTNKGGYSKPLVLPFLEDPKHCAATALLTYVSRTEVARGTIDVAHHERIPVFLAGRGQPRRLSSKRISTAVKGILRKCGIQSRAYSVRNRATTHALDAGVPAHIVQKAGRWATAATMDKHYTRPADISAVGLSLPRQTKKQTTAASDSASSSSSSSSGEENIFESE